MRAFLTACILLAFTAAFGQGGQPGQTAPAEQPINPDRPNLTNGAGITPVGRIVLELGYRQTHGYGATLQEWGDGPTWRYGVNQRLEVRLVSPAYAVDDLGDKGWEDTHIGFKYLVKDGGDGGGFRKPSYAVVMSTSVPTGSGGFRSKVMLPLFIGIAVFDFGSGGGLGANVAGQSQLGANGLPFLLYSLSLSYNHSLGGPWAAYFESYTLVPSGSGNGSAGRFVDGGVQYLLTNDCMLDASAGTRLDPHEQNAYVDAGVSFRF